MAHYTLTNYAGIMEDQPFIFESVFPYYYYLKCDEDFVAELHAIFNAFRPPFPLEMTALIVQHLREVNLCEINKTLDHIAWRNSTNYFVGLFAKAAVGVKSHFEDSRLDDLMCAVDPATLLSSFAFEALPYEFDLGHHITGLVLELPFLREFLVEVGLKRVAASDVCGPETVHEFVGVIKDYVRVMTSELFRRYGRRLLEDLNPYIY